MSLWGKKTTGSFCRHRITKGVGEGLNSKNMVIWRKACDYRDRERFKTTISCLCGGLDVCPAGGRPAAPGSAGAVVTAPCAR